MKQINFLKLIIIVLVVILCYLLFLSDDNDTTTNSQIVPTGTLNITENGIYNVSDKASVNVNVVPEEEIVETITDLTGTTWLLDEDLGIYSDRTMMVNLTTADGSKWSKFWMMGTYNINNESGALTFDDSTNFVYTNAAGWVKEEYRTITITGGQHATDELLILYLQAHARRIK